MDYENKIEIPFGAKDSELCGCEYAIPEGYEAEIKDGKVIIRKKDSDDEKTRKSLLKYLKDMCKNTSTPFSLADAKLWIAWLEKQDEKKPQKNQNANIEWGIDFTTGEMHFNNLTLEQAEELRNALLGKQKPADKVEPQVKELAETQHVKETCQENGNSLTQEPVSEGLKKAANTYMNEEIDNGADYVDKDGDYYFYATGLEYAFKAGAQWQKEQIIANTTDAMICLPYENKYGGYTHLIDVSRPLPVGNNKIAIIFKEE